MRFMLLSISLLLTFGFNAVASAQQEVQTRLDEIQELIDEEQSTITVLEGQLKDSLSDNDTVRVDQLRTEIDEAYETLEKLRELQGQLKELKDDSPPPRYAPPRVRPRTRLIPKPSIGGIEPRIEEERKRNREKKAREKTRSESRPQPSTGSSRGNRGGSSGGRSSSRGSSRRSNGTGKLGHLRDAFDALIDAGEDDMADDVQSLIDREIRKRDREDTRERDRDTNRDRGQEQSGRRPRGDGPMSADGGPVRPKSSSRDRGGSNRGGSNRDDEDIDDLRDELERLRKRLEEQERKRDRDN